jgi:hypothetical protein
LAIHSIKVTFVRFARCACDLFFVRTRLVCLNVFSRGRDRCDGDEYPEDAIPLLEGRLGVDMVDASVFIYADEVVFCNECLILRKDERISASFS